MNRRFQPVLAGGLLLAALAGPAAANCPIIVGHPEVAPDSRYTISEPVAGEVVVTDLDTSLIWKQCSEGQSGPGCASGSTSTMTWQQALAAAQASTHAGFADWRLPNGKELVSLVETGCTGPTINTTMFPATGSTAYWSSTTTTGDAIFARDVNFVDGGHGGIDKSGFILVRLVRGGQPFDAFAAHPADLQVEAVAPATDAPSLAPVVSASGRYIAFQSQASNLPDSSADGSFDVYRVDTQCIDGIGPDGAACTREVRVSLDDSKGAITGHAVQPSISADGQLVVFVAADTAVAKVRNESAKQREKRLKGDGLVSVFLRDLINGTTHVIGSTTAGAALPQLAAAGNAVVFPSLNTAGFGTPGQSDIYLVPIDRTGGGVVPRTDELGCISCKTFNADGTPSTTNAEGDSSAPVLSADGAWVAWQSAAKDTLASSPSPCPAASTEILQRNIFTNVVRRVGAPAAGGDCGTDGSGSGAPSLDYSGTRIVFQSNQPLKPGATGTDVYFSDLGAGDAPVRLSEKPDGSNVGGDSRQARISGDGQTVAFESEASDLDPVEADTNASADVYVRSLREALLRRLARSTSGEEADRASLRPALNYAGTTLVFDSEASNLTPFSVMGQATVYRRTNPFNVFRVFGTGFE